MGVVQLGPSQLSHVSAYISRLCWPRAPVPTQRYMAEGTRFVPQPYTHPPDAPLSYSWSCCCRLTSPCTSIRNSHTPARATGPFSPCGLAHMIRGNPLAASCNQLPTSKQNTLTLPATHTQTPLHAPPGAPLCHAPPLLLLQALHTKHTSTAPTALLQTQVRIPTRPLTHLAHRSAAAAGPRPAAAPARSPPWIGVRMRGRGAGKSGAGAGRWGEHEASIVPRARGRTVMRACAHAKKCCGRLLEMRSMEGVSKHAYHVQSLAWS